MTGVVENPMRGVIWDLDGVLADTAEHHFRAWAKVLVEYGVVLHREMFRDLFGLNNAATVHAMLGPDVDRTLVGAIADRKERLFLESVRGRLKPMPGVAMWLDRFRAWGCQQAVASSAPPENIEQLVLELGLREYFAALVSGCGFPAKPDPALFLDTAREIGVLPDRCVVIEDSPAGVEAARRVGMKCVAVATSHPKSLLRSADVTVESLDGLRVRCLKGLLRGK